MGFNVDWVEKNLGITRKAIRYYEKKGLIPENPKGKNRDYDENDLDKLWLIKYLMEIGFSAKEVKNLMDDGNIDFYEELTKKVEALKKKQQDNEEKIEFAKTIKLTGRLPNVISVGSMKFDDFIKYARETWNAFSRQEGSPELAVIDYISKPEELTLDKITDVQLEAIMQIMKNYIDNQHAYLIKAYYKILSELCNMDYKNDAVQIIVKLLYTEWSAGLPDETARGRCNPTSFAKIAALWFVPGSDFYISNEHDYGADACRFIAEATAYFGGFASVDELE